MKEQFVTYNIALKLKELGFNEYCLAIYSGKKFRFNDLIRERRNSELNAFDDIPYQCAAPLWQQVIDWLIEKHKLIITIGDSCGFGDPGFTYSIGEIHKNKLIITKGSPMKINDPLIDSYYNAREQAILKAIELVSNN